MTASAHPLDLTTHLQLADDGSMLGHTHPAYANMVGPFGGAIAATVLNAPLTHAARLGDPIALTVNYAGPIADGAFRIDVTPVRTNRSTQHWTMSLTQGDQVAVTATAVFAIRRDTWGATEAGFPDVPPPETLERAPALGRGVWTRNYDMRFVAGPLAHEPQAGEAPDSLSQVWLRDDPPRPLDFLGLASLCDVFFPRVMIRRRTFMPASTVSITSYFHADTAILAAHGDRAVLGTARASTFGKGYHDQVAEIWSPDGFLLATSHQIVYYKE
jgi:acyl-CoA thioesterase